MRKRQSLFIPATVGIALGVSGYWWGWIIAALFVVAALGRDHKIATSVTDEQKHEQYVAWKAAQPLRNEFWAKPGHTWRVPATGVYRYQGPLGMVEEKVRRGARLHVPDGYPTPVRID